MSHDAESWAEQFDYLLIARGDDGIHMDFPTGWALAKVCEHVRECSYSQTHGALLCDCGSIEDFGGRLLGDRTLLLKGDAEKFREAGWGPFRE